MNSSVAVAEAVAGRSLGSLSRLSSSLLSESIGIAILTTPKGSHESRVNGLSRKEKWRVEAPLRPSRPPGTSANPRSIAVIAATAIA